MGKVFFITVAITMVALSTFSQTTSTFTDQRDGKTYKTVQIGDQTWMAENLNYEAKTGCWAYDNNGSNTEIYGYLYDWETAKKVCPSGWHLPSNNEWGTIVTFLGEYEIAGGKMKSKIGWNSPNKGATNASGFTALPSGGRDENGRFNGIGNMSLWWSSTEHDTSNARGRLVDYKASHVGTFNTNKVLGISVRCVKD